MAAKILFGRLLSAVFIIGAHFVVIGLSVATSCSKHSDCDLGSYCAAGLGYICDQCRPCGASINGNLPDGYLQDDCRNTNDGFKCRNYCKEAYEDGIGECPNFCMLLRETVIPDLAMCKIELRCGSHKIPTLKDHNFARVNVSTMVPTLHPSLADADITQEGGVYHDGDEFPIGVTSIAFVARDSSGIEKARCMVNITVQDSQAPAIDCPNDTVLFTTDSKSVYFNWTEPSCEDNSNKSCDVKLIEPSKRGPINVGTSTITYKASDVWNNTNHCSFNVSIRVVRLECPDIHNDTWTNPMIIGGDEDFAFHCNQSEGSRLPEGNWSVHCVLYKLHEDELKANYDCPVVVKGPRKGKTYGKNRRSTANIWIPSCIGIILAVLIIIVMRYLYGRHKKNLRQSNDGENSNTLGVNRGVNDNYDPLSHMKKNGRPANLPMKRNGGYTELQGLQDTPSSSTPSPLGACNQRYLGSNGTVGPVLICMSWQEIVSDPATLGIDFECKHTIDNLQNQIDVIRRLNMLLDPIEEFLEYLSNAFDIEDALFKSIVYNRNNNPDKFPACQEILNTINATSNDDERRSIRSLTRVMQYFYDQGIGKQDSRIEESIQLIRHKHSESDCHL